jgi:hypothetical protein
LFDVWETDPSTENEPKYSFLFAIANLSTQPNEATTDDAFDDAVELFSQIMNEYVDPALDVLGIVLNAFCVLIWVLLLKEPQQPGQGHMFKYLLIKALCDTAYFTCDIFKIAYSCGDCAIRHSYAMQVWGIWFANYGEYVLSLCSAWLEVAATFDCFVTVSQKCTGCLAPICFYAVTFTALLFGASFNCFIIFQFQIIPHKSSIIMQTLHSTLAMPMLFCQCCRLCCVTACLCSC